MCDYLLRASLNQRRDIRVAQVSCSPSNGALACCMHAACGGGAHILLSKRNASENRGTRSAR
jgi:hypothetical protein